MAVQPVCLSASLASTHSSLAITNEKMGKKMRMKMVGVGKRGKMEVNELSKIDRPGQLGPSSETGRDRTGQA